MTGSTKKGKGTPRRPAPKKGAPKPLKKPPSRRAAPKAAGDEGFPAAFAKLLRAKKITVPKGLLEAPPEAYASMPASFVDQLANYSITELKKMAEQVAGFVRRRRDRALSEWERSPLIAELRRRGLKEPDPPVRPTGHSVSLAKPLASWTDKELVREATDWSKSGR